MIAIIDYQMGNLRSVQKAFERVGQQAHITSSAQDLLSADRIVLPGVGAFRDAIGEIKKRDLVGPIRDSIDSGKPFLGICLGLQLLFDVSYEDGQYEGLGIVPGEVVRFQVPDGHKVPHMGWNQMRLVNPGPVLAALDDLAYFYFVHSYYVAPSDPQVVAGEADYPDPFCAAIQRDNLIATQFHPEKSQTAGLNLLRGFAEWNPAPLNA